MGTRGEAWNWLLCHGDCLSNKLVLYMLSQMLEGSGHHQGLWLQCVPIWFSNSVLALMCIGLLEWGARTVSWPSTATLLEKECMRAWGCIFFEQGAACVCLLDLQVLAPVWLLEWGEGTVSPQLTADMLLEKKMLPWSYTFKNTIPKKIVIELANAFVGSMNSE